MPPPLEQDKDRPWFLQHLADTNWPLLTGNANAVDFFEAIQQQFWQNLATLPGFIARPSGYWSGFVNWLTGRGVYSTISGMTSGQNDDACELIVDEWEGYNASLDVDPYTGEDL